MPLLPSFRPLPVGSFRFEVYECLGSMGTAATPMQVAEAMGHGGQKGRRKQQRIRGVMAALVKTGHLHKVGARLYKRWDDDNEYEASSLKEALVEYIEERGHAQFQQLVAHFKEYSEGSIRTTLYLLQREGVLEKSAYAWLWRGNVIDFFLGLKPRPSG